jgi:hypothetical protein
MRALLLRSNPTVQVNVFAKRCRVGSLDLSLPNGQSQKKLQEPVARAHLTRLFDINHSHVAGWQRRGEFTPIPGSDARYPQGA